MSSNFDYSINVVGSEVSLVIKSIDSRLGEFAERKNVKGNTKQFTFRWYPRGVTCINAINGMVELSNSKSAGTTNAGTPAKAKTYAAQLTKAIEALCAEFATKTAKSPVNIKDHFTYELNLDTKKGEIYFEVSKQSPAFTKFVGSGKNTAKVRSAATVELHGSVDHGVSTIFIRGHHVSATSHTIRSTNTAKLVKVFGEVSAQLELAVKEFLATHTEAPTSPFKKYTSLDSSLVGHVILSLRDGEKSLITVDGGRYYAVGLQNSKGFHPGSIRGISSLDTESVILGTLKEYYDAGSSLRDATHITLAAEGKVPKVSEFRNWNFAS